MTEARPFASLSSGLLARKGAAKPAMRPQGFGSFGSNIEDLGWDDMGDDPVEPAATPEHVPSSIAALTPSPRYGEPPAVHDQRRALAESLSVDDEDEAAPEALAPSAPEQEEQNTATEQGDLHEQEEPQAQEQEQEQEQERALAPEPAPAPAPVAMPVPAEVVAIPRRTKMLAARDKSAFTLRLDPDRHFRLRLACAVSGRSAQQIVTDALDDMLKTIPELDALAGQIPAKARARR
jgi:hypothetical protein